MKTRYGRSPWIDNVPAAQRPVHPKLRGEQAADVVIIGAGLTGCATAQACAAAGLRVVVLEADRIGHGSAGRSAGLLLAEPGPSFKDLAGAHGLRAARRVFQVWQRGARDGAALMRRLAIKCELDRLDTLTIAKGSDVLLKREYDSRAAAGIEARWLTPAQVRRVAGVDAAAAIRQGDSFALDPYRACLGLAAAAVKRRALIFERSAATKVRLEGSGVTVHAGAAVVRAATVIVATGIPTAEFKPLRRHFTRRQTYQVLTAPLSPAVRKEIGARAGSLRDLQSPPHRLCWTKDHRIVVAGGDQDEPSAHKRDAVLVQRTGQLMYELLTMFPAIAGLKPDYGWDLSYGATADGLMYVGAHRNFPRHLFALGGGSDSVTGAFVAAALLLRQLRNDAEKGDAVLGWTR